MGSPKYKIGDTLQTVNGTIGKVIAPPYERVGDKHVMYPVRFEENPGYTSRPTGEFGEAAVEVILPDLNDLVSEDYL